MFVQDDTGEILCKVGRYDFSRMAPDLLKNVKPKKSIYAIKGKVSKFDSGFTILWVKRYKYLGEIDDYGASER